MKYSALVVSLSFSVLSLSTVAHAGESSFGWIYTADLQPVGKVELEQKAFWQHRQAQGQYDNLKLQTEVEYGVTENFQTAVYLNSRIVNAKQNNIDGTTGGPETNIPADHDPFASRHRSYFESVSFENIYRVMNPLTDPIGLALYVEPEIGPHVRELETRVIAQKNFMDDRLIVAANLMAASEREEGADNEIERASMIDTTLGFSYRFVDNWSAGLEYRNHQEFLGYRFQDREHSAHFFGPNLHYAAKNWWATVAWRHQLPMVQALSQDQKDVVKGDRIYGDEHARDEFMFKVGFPF